MAINEDGYDNENWQTTVSHINFETVEASVTHHFSCRIKYQNRYLSRVKFGNGSHIN